MNSAVRKVCFTGSSCSNICEHLHCSNSDLVTRLGCYFTETFDDQVTILVVGKVGSLKMKTARKLNVPCVTVCKIILNFVNFLGSLDYRWI